MTTELSHPERERYASQIEFRPGNPKVVHHALLFLDRAGVARKNETEPGSGYECFGAPGFLGGGLGGWSPGSPPIRMPEGASTILSGNPCALNNSRIGDASVAISFSAAVTDSAKAATIPDMVG